MHLVYDGFPLRLGSDRHGDQTGVFAIAACDLDQGLIIVLGDHLELTVGKALAALWALEPARLPPKNIENIHAFFLPGYGRCQAPDLISTPSDKPLTDEVELVQP
jgi:hypothetical protein